MKIDMETELLAGEIGYLHPRRAKWKDFLEALGGAAAIALFTYFMLVILPQIAPWLFR